jgi:hypothetical protein
MNEVRTRNVHATRNPDGTWHVTLTKPDGNMLVCQSTPEALMHEAVETGNRLQPQAPEPSGLAAFLSLLFSPTAITAIATSLLLYGRC